MMILKLDATPEELAVFLEEAEEQLQLLDHDILLLEKQGPTAELLQEVFRAAHTLKGSSATLGHERMARLTHMMESILDHLRQGKIAKTEALVDILLQSLDALRILKDEVVTMNTSEFDPSSLVAALQAFLDGAQQHEAGAERTNAHPPARSGQDSGALHQQLEATAQAAAPVIEGSVYSIVVAVDQESALPMARFLQVHLALAELGAIAESDPAIDDLDGTSGETKLRLKFVTSRKIDEVCAVVKSIPEIEQVEINGLEIDRIAENARKEFDYADQTENIGLHEKVGEPTPAILRNLKNAPESGRSDEVSRFAETNDRSIDKINPNRLLTDQKNTASKTVRIDIERLDDLLNLVGELVIACTRLGQLGTDLQTRYDGEELAQAIAETSLQLQRTTDELQDGIMKARMFPVSSVFTRFPRMVRDLAQRAGKKVEFTVEGEETELDRSVIEEISDPLIHLLRNAVDHGIETPEARRARGKPAAGTIRLSAAHRENRIVLTVEDDGRGIDAQRLRQLAVERELLSAEAVARMSDREALDIIFVSGFSTAERVSDVSGRGVGMDIVRTNIRRLGGTVNIESAPGRGSRFILELPLTLAIMDALLVTINSSIYAIPLASVTETLRLRRDDVKSVNRESVIQLRGRVLPLLPLGRALGLVHDGGEWDKAYVVVVGAGADRAGIVVDSLVGEQQVVIKSLGRYIGDVQGISGATILGDGRVALILDVLALVRKRIRMRVTDVIHV